MRWSFSLIDSFNFVGSELFFKFLTFSIKVTFFAVTSVESLLTLLIKVTFFFAVTIGESYSAVLDYFLGNKFQTNTCKSQQVIIEPLCDPVCMLLFVESRIE